MALSDTYTKIGDIIYLNAKGEAKIKQYFDKKNDVHHDAYQTTSNCIKNDAAVSSNNSKPNHISYKKTNHITSTVMQSNHSSIESLSDNKKSDVHHTLKNDVHHITSHRIKIKTKKTETKNLIHLMQTTINELSMQLQKKDKQIDDLSRLLENTQKLQMQLQVSTLETKSLTTNSIDDEPQTENINKKSFFNKFFFRKK